MTLGRDGHFLVVGAPGSGKTTLLQTLITSLALDHSPADVNIYVLDFGGRLLKLFEHLPHVGAVLLPDEEERIGRLIRMLLGVQDRNKELLAAEGVGTFAAYRAQVGPAKSPPVVILILDNFTEFANAFPDLVDDLTRFAREGGNLGLHVILTASSAGAIPMRLGNNIALAAALALTDAGDYGSVVGRTGGLVPERGVRGRGLIRDTSPLEFQTATPAAGQSEAERVRGLRDLIAGMASGWDGPPAPPIKQLPDLFPLSDLQTPSPTWDATETGSLAVPIGLDAESLAPLSIDIHQDSHILVTGSPLSGKTTLLQTWLLALAERYSPDAVRFVIVSMASPLFLPFSRLPHLIALVEDDDRLATVVESLQAEMESRQVALDTARRAARGALSDEDFLARYPVIVIAIDDFDPFLGLANEGSKETLVSLVRRGRRLGFRFLVAGPSRDLATSWEAIAKALKEAQTGILLDSSDLDDLGLFNLRVPAAEAGKSLPPGRGYFGRRGRFQRVQVASSHVGSPALMAWTAAIAEKRSAPVAGSPGPAGNPAIR